MATMELGAEGEESSLTWRRDCWSRNPRGVFSAEGGLQLFAALKSRGRTMWTWAQGRATFQVGDGTLSTRSAQPLQTPWF